MSDDPLLNGSPISGLKVVELRKELECRGLSKSGVKKDLFERLRDHLNRVGPDNDQPIDFEAEDEPAAAAGPRATRSSLSPRKGASPTKQPSPVMNKFVAQYLQNQQATLQEHRREVAPEVTPESSTAQPSSSSEEVAEVSSTTMSEEVKSPEKPKGSPKKAPVEEAPPPAEVEQPTESEIKAETLEEPTSLTQDAAEAEKVESPKMEETTPISVESKEEPAEKIVGLPIEAVIPTAPEVKAQKESDASSMIVETGSIPEEPVESMEISEAPKTDEKTAPLSPKKTAESPKKSEKPPATIAHEISPRSVETKPKTVAPKADSQPEAEDEKPVEEAPKQEEQPVRKRRPMIVFDIDTKPTTPTAASAPKAARLSPTTPATPVDKAAANRRKITPPSANASSESLSDAVPKAAAPKPVGRCNSVGMKQPRAPSPARHDPTEYLHISNLKRPYTQDNLHLILQQFGEYSPEEDFWIDRNLRSNCIVKYDSIETARKAREELHGCEWPNANDRIRVEYTTEEMLLRRQKDNPSSSGKKASLQEPAGPGRIVIHVQNDRRSSPTTSSGRKRERSADKSRASQDSDWDKTNTPPRKEYDLDNLFKKTKALPHLYWLPLSDAEAEKRNGDRAERNGARAEASKASTSSSQRRRSPSPARRSPARRRPARSRSRSPVMRDRRRSPPRRRVSRSPVRRRR